MKLSTEKINNYFVLCSLDLEGKTVYLRSLHDLNKWEIVTDIEMATKTHDYETAELLKECYDREIGDAEWAIVPEIITFQLIDET